ncbi:MAG: hypothetical protein JWL79_2960 [Frankiales bacterium]|nr:hypothetical protein [Frankiales bacterium]
MRRYAVSLVLLLSLIGLWELATPLLAAPDEPQHLVKAAAVARGQWLGRGDPIGPRTHVSLPAGFGELGRYPRCFAFRPRRPASCAPQVTSHAGPLVDVTTTAGRYPPAYYGLVGLPTRAVTGIASDRAARVLSGLLCALLLAAAITWAAGDLLALAVPVLVTPMVLFLGAVVNPSGVEVAAAAATWVGLLRLVHGVGPVPRTRLIGVTSAAAALALARPISPLWLVLIPLTVAFSAPRPRLRELVRQRSVQLAGAVLFVVAVAQTAWVILAQSTRLSGRPVHVSRFGALRRLLTARHVGHLSTQLVGRFGWLDTGAPRVSVALWAGLAVVMLVIGVMAGRRRLRIAFVGALCLGILVPAAVEASSFPRIGYWWQGRYSLPYLVGLPLLAVVGRSLGHLRTRLLAAVVAVAVVVAQLDAFASALARYTVGVGHGWGLGRVSWHPPLPPVTLVIAFGLVVVLWTAWSCWLARGHEGTTPAER